MDVSIIIVNYNTEKLLYNCLKSIFQNVKDIDFEVIISDNGSTDDSKAMVENNFPQCKFIENKKNLGFGAANNVGLKQATGKYIFYLNSDTVLLNNSVKIFFDYFESHKDENIGALGAPLLNEKLNIIHSYGQFASSKINITQLLKANILNIILSFFYIFHISPKRFKSEHTQEHYTGPVDYITGADLFLKNDSNALFDEYFFLYFEESDLQRKMISKNLTRQIIDGPRIQHLCGGSVSDDYSIKRKASFSRIQYEISRTKYEKRYNKSKICLFIVKFLITLNWINPFLFSKTKSYIKTIWKI